MVHNKVLEGLELNKEIQIEENIQWGGYWYKSDNQFK